MRLIITFYNLSNLDIIKSIIDLRSSTIKYTDIENYFRSKFAWKSDLSGRRLEGCTSGTRVGSRFAPVGRYFPCQASARERSAPNALPSTALKRPRFGDPS